MACCFTDETVVEESLPNERLAWAARFGPARLEVVLRVESDGTMVTLTETLIGGQPHAQGSSPPILQNKPTMNARRRRCVRLDLFGLEHRRVLAR